MRKASIFVMAALALLTAQCKKNEPKPEEKVMVPISGTVDFGGGSKTEITTAGYITPMTGDVIYIYKDNSCKGSMTCTSISGQQFSCSGEIVESCLGKTCTFMYLGTGSKEGNGSTDINSNSTTISFAKQTDVSVIDGKISGLNKFHVGSCKATVSGTGTVTLPMATKMSIAYFQLKDEGGTPIAAGKEVTIRGVSSSAIINTIDGTLEGEEVGTEDPGITVTTDSYGRFYMALIPQSGAVTFNFAVEGKVGSYVFPYGIRECSFYSHEGNGSAMVVPLDYEYVDLGLSVKWATCNLGAEHPYDYGNYYAWGETAGYNEKMDGEGANAGESYSPGTVKADYYWAYYKWGRGEKSLGKYVNKTGYGMATPDGLTTLESVDDAATKNWGSAWRMPTEEEFTELIDNTTRTWYGEGNTDFNGVAGWKCANKLDATKYIFLPAAGYRYNTSLFGAGIRGHYWSTALSTSNPALGRYLFFLLSSDFYMGAGQRDVGVVVRPVCPSQN